MISEDIVDYSLNLEAIFDFIAKDDKNEFGETEVTDSFDVSGELIQNNGKIIRELKSKGNNQRDNIRYDLIKVLIAEVFAPERFDDVSQMPTFTTGSHIAFNTLIENNMLKKIQ